MAHLHLMHDVREKQAAIEDDDFSAEILQLFQEQETSKESFSWLLLVLAAEDACMRQVDYIKRLSTVRPCKVTDGRSRAFFGKSSDGRLMVKGILTIDLKNLLGILPSYAEHVTNQRTSLALILGAYECDGWKFITMETIAPIRLAVRESGSLKEKNIVDYSFYMAETETGDYVVGIIDYLMTYSWEQGWAFVAKYHWRRPFFVGMFNLCKYHCLGGEAHYVQPAIYKDRVLSFLKAKLQPGAHYVKPSNYKDRLMLYLKKLFGPQAPHR